MLHVRAIVLPLLLLPQIGGAQPAPAAAPGPVKRAVGMGPMRFEPNHGQTDPHVAFVARGEGYQLFLTGSDAVFRLRDDGSRADRVLRLQLLGSQTARSVLGEMRLAGGSNYLKGPQREWKTGIPAYGRVRYAGVYDGIDLVYYGNERQLEYDFVVAPGADPRAIKLRFAGADTVRIDGNGDLVIRAGPRELRQPRPIAYQDIEGERRQLSAEYVVRRNAVVSLKLGAYDPRLPLTIDPVLIYSTFLGGSDELGGASEIAVDSTGAFYVAGGTTSVDFPTTSGALRRTHGGGDFDAFIVKFNPEGRVVYSTYFGGHDYNAIGALAVDASGAVYVAGVTNAVDFPTTAGAFRTACARVTSAGQEERCFAGFVSKLDPSGSSLVFSTYLGPDVAATTELPVSPTDIALDENLNVILAGSTGKQLPVTAGVFQSEHRGVNWTGFVAKLNSAGSDLMYASYLGGDHFDSVIAMATDADGNVYLTGTSRSDDFPTTDGAFQRTCATISVPTSRGCWITFVTKVNNAATAILYSTLLGGVRTVGPAVDGLSSDGLDIAVDQYGFAYVTGKSFTSDFPTTPGSFKPAAGTWDAFITKLNLTGTGLVYSTLLGGELLAPGGFMHESGIAIQLDPDGGAYVAGVTSATDFPLVNPIQPDFGGYDWDAFIAHLNPSGSALTFSTFLGGGGTDDLGDLARDAQGNLYVAGQTRSVDFPLVNPAQSSFPGSKTSFVAKIGEPVCGTEVTGQVQVFQSAIVPFFPPFNLQLVIAWNNSPSPVQGPVAYVMDDLQNAVFVGLSNTRCFSPAGDPLTLIPIGDDNVLAPNEARLFGLLFYRTQTGPISYTPRLLSGNRNY